MRLSLTCTALLVATWLSTSAFAVTHSVSISNFAFAPQSLTIQPGDTVQWTNNDSYPHTVTGTDGSFDSSFLQVGGTFSHAFAAIGSFAYVCQYHSNMSGVINSGTSGGTGDTTWTELDSPTALPLNDVRFWDSQTGWIAGDQGVLLTTDGGASWELVPTPEDLEAVFFVSASEGWVCGNDGYVAHTTNGGHTWLSQVTNAPDKLRDIWFADAQNGWAVGKDGILIHTSNGGQNWSQQDNPATRDLRGIQMLDSERGWAVGSRGLVLFTTDGGANWDIQLEVPDGEEDDFEAVMAMDDNNVWICGGQGRIFYSANGGLAWTPQSSGTALVLNDIFFTAADNGWTCGAAGFLSAGMELGDMWHTQEPPAVTTFNAVYFVNDSLGFLVSADGRIFRREISQLPNSAPHQHGTANTSFELLNNYPNPFNPSTTIEFILASAGQTSLIVYDVLGQQVAQPLKGNLAAGSHRVEFNAINLPGGMYFYQLTSGGYSESRKMILLK